MTTKTIDPVLIQALAVDDLVLAITGHHVIEYGDRAEEVIEKSMDAFMTYIKDYLKITDKRSIKGFYKIITRAKMTKQEAEELTPKLLEAINSFSETIKTIKNSI